MVSPSYKKARNINRPSFLIKSVLLESVLEGKEEVIYYKRGRRVKQNLYGALSSFILEDHILKYMNGKLTKKFKISDKDITKRRIFLKGLDEEFLKVYDYNGKASFISSYLLKYLLSPYFLSFRNDEKFKGIVENWLNLLTLFSYLDSELNLKFRSRDLNGNEKNVDKLIDRIYDIYKNNWFSEIKNLEKKADLCMICLENTELTTHHIIPSAFFRRYFKENHSYSKKIVLKKFKEDYRNKVALCKKCHQNLLERILDNLYLETPLSLMDLVIIPANLFALKSIVKHLNYVKKISNKYKKNYVYNKVKESITERLVELESPSSPIDF